jgi:pimeloyl-ACP methyl ester carboxylesterase
VIVYLHGFASSPRSTKAAFFAERLGAHGVPLSCPDFNQPDFTSLTMTRMLAQLAAEVEAAPGEPVTLIGSSLGGTVAVLAASRMPERITQLVLLAPAVLFAKPGHHLLGPERVEEWRAKGVLPFFHYGTNSEQPLDVAFYDDSLQYDAFNAPFEQPALVFQGRHDQSVDAASVEAFCRTRPRATLSLLDDDHQLYASLPRIWTDVEAFLGLID